MSCDFNRLTLDSFHVDVLAFVVEAATLIAEDGV